MSEPNQKNVSNPAKAFRNFAAGCAIFVPAVSLICQPFLMQLKISPFVPAWMLALVFGSSFVMGLFGLFSKSLEVGIRALVFVGMLVSALGVLSALIVWLLSGLGC